jgi:hypothetical protein
MQTELRFSPPNCTSKSTVHSESCCALRLRYVDMVVSIEVAVKVCCCFAVLSCQTAVEVQYR